MSAATNLRCFRHSVLAYESSYPFFIRQLYPSPSISASLYHIHSLNQSMDSTGFSLKTSPFAETPRKSLQPASYPRFPPSESARALLMRSVKNCPPWIPQKAVSRLIPIPHPWFVKDSALLFRLPGEWQVCSDRPLCRRLGNGQAATLLQSNILLKTCHYRDKISTCYCCAVPVPFQRLYNAFLRY